MYIFFHNPGGVASCYATFWDMGAGHHALRADDAVVFYHALLQDSDTIGHPYTISNNDITTKVNPLTNPI